jgi:hypothetical protein
MLVTQELIETTHAARVATAGFAARGVRAIAVVRSFDAAEFIRASVQFARGLPVDLGREWVASFTRTVFLAGDPDNLSDRFPGGRLAPDGSSLWFSPSGLDDQQGLSRLLRPFRGPLGVPAADGVRVVLDQESSSTARLCVATDGLGVEDYLIHVNHVLAEACLQGLLDGVSAIELTHVRAIEVIEEPYSYLRVLPDKGIVWAVLAPSEIR